MWGAFIVLCGIGIFIWLIVCNTSSLETSEDDKNDRGRVEDLLQNGGGKRRARRKGGKKGSKQNTVSNNNSAVAVVQPAERSIRKQERDSRKQALNDQEWPTLGKIVKRDPSTLDPKANLAAIHAALLDAKQGQLPRAAEATKSGGRENNTGRMYVGDRVEARFEGGFEWFPATITKMLHGGLVNLAYDDGGKENRVHSSLLRRPGLGAEQMSDEGEEETGSKPEDFAAAENATRSFAGGRHGQELKRSDWKVQNRKVKKAPQERQEARVEANTNLKNRLKRQKKREKEVAAREALRKKL